MTLAVSALFVLAGWLLRESSALPASVPIVAAAERPGSDWYLSYNRESIDHAILYHDLSDSTAPLKRANVLFLGNSRVMFAFPQEVLAEFFGRLGLSAYVMAFPYDEGQEFAEALIRKHDLHPKWVIVNASPFFVERESDMADLVRRESVFDAWKRRFETVASYEVRHRLHQVLPYFDPFAPESDWVLFRNAHDGTTMAAAHKGVASPAKIQHPLARARPGWIARAKEFQQELRARGAELVLTTLPPVPPNLAIDFGEALGVPVILPDVPPKELMTLDGSHLDPPSARRYAAAFLLDLEKVLRGEELPSPERFAPPFREKGERRKLREPR